MRVISLCPSLTETVFCLGRGHLLVGRTKFCVQPEGAVNAVERVGGTKNPKLERIVALAPDLVLMNEEENRREDAEALAAHGVAVLSTFARDVAGAAATVVEIGAAIGAAAAGQSLAAAITQRAAAVAARARARPPRGFLYLIWQKPWMAVAPGTYIDGLLQLAGGVNVISDPATRYPEVDQALLAQAELILLSSEPFPFAAKHRAEMIEQTQLPEQRFRLVDGQLLSWHGARTLQGLLYAEQALA
jgi:ABC-type Fe3+-hydroxamate transport system substrate-binding protein